MLRHPSHCKGKVSLTISLHAYPQLESGLEACKCLQSLTARSSISHQSSIPNGHSSTDDNKAPRQVYYDAVHASGQRPSGRWSHACATLDDRLFIFGGASSMWHSESYVFNAGEFSHQHVYICTVLKPGSADKMDMSYFGWH